MSEAKPYPKSVQLARGQRRYRRKVASEKQWQAIIEAKGNACRLCEPTSNGHLPKSVQYHHVVARDAPFFGDDLPANIVPLCGDHHPLITNREPDACKALCASLTDAEYAYAVQKCGESFFERAYGVTYER